jgi:RNA polymerase sigma-70 factor (ECF subfamily)
MSSLSGHSIIFEPFLRILILMSNGPFAGQDLELLKQISAGDEEAFRRLYDLTHRKVYFYLYRLVHGKQTAEDILIETYAEVWKCASKFRGDSRATTWIMGIARNLAMNELGKSKKHENIDDFPNLSDGVMPDPEPMDRQRLIQEAMSKLTLKHREVLDLVFFCEMTYEEVSRVLEIPVNTVKTRVFYAKETLRNVLSSMGIKRDDL